MADLTAQAERFDPIALTQDITILEELRRQIRQSQAGRALLDATLVRMALSDQFSSIGDLLSRLDGGEPAETQKKNDRIGVAQPPSAVIPPPQTDTSGPELAKPANPAYRRNLPHIQATGRPLFVTFRTADGLILPESVRERILEHCRHDHGVKLEMHAAVVMPDHVHLIFTAMEDSEGNTYGLAEIMIGIKGASAHSVNKMLARTGQLWQDESFDHVLRADENLADRVEYLRLNPVRKGLVVRAEEYRWSWTDPALMGQMDLSQALGWGRGITAEGGCATSWASGITAGGGCATRCQPR